MLTQQPAEVPHRDAEATRERILAAALAEFSAKGFAGARIQAIAKRAGVNVRMLYHYFGEKDDLYRAIRRRRFAERPVDPIPKQASLAAHLANWFSSIVANPDWVRLNQWESLEVADGPIVEEEERHLRWQAAVERLRAAQLEHPLAPDLEPDLMLLVMVALTTYPVAFPHTVRWITGTSPEDPRFQRRYRAFLARLSVHLTAHDRDPQQPQGSEL